MYTKEQLIEEFRLTIPAMADVTDEQLASDFETYRDYVSEKRFGKLFPKALAYFVAHMRTLNAMIADAASAGDASLTAGTVTHEKEGDLERSYSAVGASTSDADAMLKRTLYGQAFLQLRAMVIVPVTVRRRGNGYC